jgi:hypothetical protein
MPKTTKLSMAPQVEPEDAERMSAQRRRETVIRTHVLAALGQPPRLFRVAIIPLWANNFRVNVLTGEDAASVTIPHSYFVTADDLGNILGSTPRIEKQY